jgi:capsular exopolysaccharide synthesis family protein
MQKLLPRLQRQSLRSDEIDSEYPYTSESEEVHLREYWKVFLKRRRLAATVFLVVFVVGAYCVFTATRLYTATATLKIEPQNPTVTGFTEMLRLEGSAQLDYHQTQVALLQSRTLAAKVISDLQLESNPAFTRARIVSPNPLLRFQNVFFGFLSPIIQYVAGYFEAPPPAKSKVNNPRHSSKAQSSTPNHNIPLKSESVFTGLYRSFLKVEPIKGTRLVDVEFSTPDPQLSQELANEHAGRFIRMNLETRFELTKEAREFLDKKNAELKEKLERSEDELNRFRQKHGVVSLEKGENIVIDRLVDLNRQLTAARAQRIEAESLHKVVENRSTLSLSQVINQGLIPQLRSTLLTLEAEKVKLLAVLKLDHPRMVELNQQITEARRSLSAEISGVVRGIEQSYAAARAKERALEAEAQKQQKTALDLKEVGVAYAVREEEVKVNRTLYESVLKRLSETSLANHDIALSNMQLSQLAERPRGPSSPNLPVYLILIAAVGTILGIALVIVVEYFDSSVSTPERVWSAVGLSTFGVIPDLNSLSRGLFAYSRRLLTAAPANNSAISANASLHSQQLVSYDPRSVLGEAFRTIRTSPLFAQAERPPQVILLTSPSPTEGKTLTTLNLGIALAQEGHTVLVIDADLRRGCCHSRLGITNHDGLSNVLVGKLPLQQATKKTSVERLSLLSRGMSPPNPSDLLGSQMMRRLLDEVRKSYDFILIDSPPAIAVTDAPILSVLSDGVVLVLHATKTTAAYARQLVERLDGVRATFLGVVLNGINLANPDYSYYKHYYGSHYAGETKEANNGADRTIILTVEAQSPKTNNGFAELDSETVSPQFFDYLIVQFTEVVGPMAHLIVRDEAAKLGESFDSFPKKRLKHLIDNISVAILNDDLRDEFQKKMCTDTDSPSDRLI